ncbi:MAG: thioredoxin [Gammaproteobacteria bacterium]|nr:MAG: thioredoxin [Gammaproteobacteria bacterium]
MKKYKKWLLQFLIVIVIFFGIRFYQQQNLITGVAPTFNQKSLNDESINLASYQGDPVLVHFWANWCPICKAEQSNINITNDYYKIITIASFSQRDEIKKYVSDNDLNWTVVYDSGNLIAKKYGIKAVPASFFVNSKGEIKFTEVGYTTTIGFLARMFLFD